MGLETFVSNPVKYGEPETLLPGLEIRRALGVSGLGEIVFHVCAAPSLKLPKDAPAPVAELLVLNGRLKADDVVFEAGDFLSLEDTPTVTLATLSASGCTYLMTGHDALGSIAD